MRRSFLPWSLVLLSTVLSLSACKNDDEETSVCLPTCSPGYFCLSGVCIEDCNPPCPTGLSCNEDRVCEAPDGDVSESDTQSDAGTDAPEDTTLPTDTDDVAEDVENDDSIDAPDADDVALDADAADGSAGWDNAWLEPDCTKNEECPEANICVGGACVPDAPREPGPWGPMGVLTNVDLGDGLCCFDLNGDGFLDNDGAALLSSTSFGSDDPIGDLNLATDFGLDSLLVEVLDTNPDDGVVELGFFVGRNDVDSDGRPDQTPAEREAGQGVFTLRGEALVDGHAPLRFPTATLVDGQLRTTQADIDIQAPYIGRCSWLWFEQTPFENGARCRTENLHPVSLRTVVADGTLTVTEDGLTSGDAWIQVGGLVHVTNIVEAVNTNYGDNCLCAGIAPDEDLLTLTLGEFGYEVACAREIPQEDIDQCPIGVRQCDGIAQACDLAGVIPSVLTYDSDTDGVRDSLAVGLRMQIRPATIAEPALAPRFEFCSNDVDDDGDGATDCDDAECWDNNSCDWVFPGEYCNDTIDNDRDEIADCEDPSCARNRACVTE